MRACVHATGSHHNSVCSEVWGLLACLEGQVPMLMLQPVKCVCQSALAELPSTAGHMREHAPRSLLTRSEGRREGGLAAM
jgi:hypothetical protein